MTEFLNTETHTPVLLMNHLWSLHPREMWIWVNTVFLLTSLKTEIARSVKGPKLQGHRAEDAMAKPYLVLNNLETLQETQRSLQKFREPDRNPKVIYTDNALEFGKACEDLPWNHCASTPHRSETNGIGERAVRRVKEGTFAVLLQSGLDEEWWADSMECFTYLRNFQDLLSDGKTPYERRFGETFKWPIIPFGAMIECHPSSPKDQMKIHQFGKKVLPRLFLGYALYAGGIWKGDVLVADIEELETMDASEIYSKRLSAKEVIFPKETWEFIFPIADGRIKILGGDQELRTSTLIRDHPIREEGHVDFLGESEGSLPPPEDSLPDAGEATNDFWSMSGNFMYRHHVEPRVKLYSPREESFPVPLKYIDVSRTYSYKFGCWPRTPHRRLLEHRWVKRFVWFLDRFHSVYSVRRETSRPIYVVRERDWQESSWHPGQIIYVQNSGRKWEEMLSWGEA